MSTIVDVAERENRDLTGRETVEIRKIESEIANLDAQIAADNAGVDPDVGLRSQGGTTRTVDPDAALLRSDQSLAEWVGVRHGFGFQAGETADDFSLGRVVRAAMTGDRRNLSGVELRAMSEGTDSQGGFLVPEQLSSNVIDLARANAVVFQAGAQVAPMETDTLNLARLATGNSANWKSENAAVTGSDQVWEKLTLTAKTVVVNQILSRELFEDLSPAGEAAIRHEIASAIALKLDLAALEGSGTDPEPKGLGSYVAGDVPEISMGTNGAAPTNYDEVVKATFSTLKNDGADPTAAVFHPRDLETYALLKDTTNQPLRRPSAIESLPFLSSSQIDTTRDQGTSTGVASNAYVGDFRQMVVGVRPRLQIRFQLLDQRYADNLQVAILAWLRADVGLAHENHFAKIVGLLAS